MKRPTAVIDALWAQRAHEAFRGAIAAFCREGPL